MRDDVDAGPAIARRILKPGDRLDDPQGLGTSGKPGPDRLLRERTWRALTLG
jgi:hypothetical protein